MAVCFFGEGALGQGLLYEVMNLASLWKLPVIYVCENNQYNEYTNYRETTAGEVAARPKRSASTPKPSTARMSSSSTRRARSWSNARAAAKGRPSCSAITYRFHGHHVGDIDRAYYRPKTEEEEWMSKRDPIKLLAEWLTKSEMADGKLLDRIEGEIATEMKEAVHFALNAPYPDPNEVNQDVYA